MSIYTYPDSDVIDAVTFRQSEGGQLRAYLHAKPGVSQEQVNAVFGALYDKNYQATTYILDGQPTLEVRGFKTEEKFLELLHDNKWVSGDAHVEKDKVEPPTFMDKFRMRSLQASGVAMSIADLGFIIYGLKESKMHKAIDPSHEKRDLRDALAGFAYLSGSTVLTAYGRNDKSDLQVREVAELILKHAKDKGLNVPDSTPAHAIANPKKDNALTKLHNFFREYPSEIGNMSYFAAGGLIAWSALQNRALSKPREGMSAKQIQEMRKGGWGDAALGSTTMLSGLIGTLGKEKAPDPNAPEYTGIEKWWDQLKRSPLAIAGLGYMGSTLCHAYTTYVERKEAKRAFADKSLPAKEHMLAEMKLKAVPWRVLFIGATIVGEILLTISSKGHGEGVQVDNTVDGSVYALTADLIARQPAEMREGLIDYMAGYMADPKVLGGDRKKIAEKLRVDVAAMAESPWVLKQSKDKKAEASAIGTDQSKQIPNWQTKVAAQSAAGSQPQISS